MRTAIVIATLVVLVGLNGALAQVPKLSEVPKNLETLKNSKSAQDRAYAAEQLGLRGQVRATDVKAAVDPLLEAVKSDDSPNVRKAAAKAIGQIAPDADKAVPALMDALKDTSKDVRMSAALALAAFGAEARPALPALRELAQEKDKRLSKAAKMAIKSISGKKKG
jgi:ribosomal protein S20